MKPVTFVVQGKIIDQVGKPRSGLAVKAFDRNVGGADVPLGQATTDEQGNYAISYSSGQLEGKSAADLILSVSEDGQLLQSSDVIFNAQPTQVYDFTIPVIATPEFSSLLEKVQPLLRSKVSIGELDQGQVKFLGQKTSLDAQKIRRLAQCHALAGEDQTLAAFFYGLQSQNFPLDPQALLARPPEAIRAALGRAASANQIPPLAQADIDKILNDVLPRKRAENLLKPAPARQKSSIGDLLQTLPQALPVAKQVKLADLVAQKGINYEQLPRQLTDAGFQPRQAKVIERTLRLAELTQNHLPLVRKLQGKLVREKDGSLRGLVKLGRDQWIDLAYECGTPAGAGQAPEAYARQIEASVEQLHPTAALAARLEQGDLVIFRPDFEPKLGFFLRNNPDLDLLAANIPGFVDKANLAGIEDKVRLASSLVKLQRVKRLGAAWDEAGALLNQHLDSALEVVGIGLQRLQQRLSGVASPERATVLYQNAKNIHDAALGLMAQIAPRFSPTPVAAMGSSTRLDEAGMKAALKDFPNLQEIFGTLDYCQCDPDGSVLSPAAYFVDLLQFLKNAGGSGPSDSAPLNALLDRRPDLVELEMTPENTRAELPYIDLVLEILENAVAFAQPITITLQSGQNGADILNQPSLPPQITAELQKTSLETIGSSLQAQPVQKEFDFDTCNTWTVTDAQRRWSLQYQPGEVIVTNAGRKWIGRMKPTSLKASVRRIDSGELPASLQRSLTNLIQQDPGKRYFSVDPSSFSITAIVPGKQWKVSYTLGARVTTEVQGDQGILTIHAREGKSVFNRTYSSKAVQATKIGLEKKTVAGVLRALLPAANKPGIEPVGSGFDLSIPGGGIIFAQPDSLVINALTYQTTGESADLEARPQNQNPAAYEILRSAVFPWSLPFDLPLESVRVCLKSAKTSRRRLIELCKPQNHFCDPSWAYELLGIPAEEAQIITGMAFTTSKWAYWGFAPSTQDQDPVSIYDASAGANVTGMPLAVLSRVSILMQQARLTYDELLSILNTQFVGGRLLTFSLVDENGCECCPSNLQIDKLNSTHLDRIHRLTRLWRKSGWVIEDLDYAFHVFRDKSVNQDFLVFLAQIERLHESLDIPVQEVISWWGFDGNQALLYRPYTPPGQPKPKTIYEQVFLNPFIQTPSDPDFALKSDLSGLQNSGVKLSDKAAEISAALGIQREDFDLLLSQSGLVDLLNLDTLHALYRMVSLVKALGLTIRDHFSLSSLMPYNLVDTTSAIGGMPDLVSDMVRYCETVQFVQGSGFTIEELGYLLQHEAVPNSSVALSDDALSQALSSILAAIQAKLNSIDHQITALIQSNPAGPSLLPKLTDAEALKLDSDNLTIGFAPGDSLSSVSSNLVLDTQGVLGSDITWNSSDSNVIGTDGKVTRPDSKQADASVVLTAAVSNSGKSNPVTKEFNLTVLKQLPDDQTAADAAAAGLRIRFAEGDRPGAVTRDLALPARGMNQATIAWSFTPDIFTIKTDLSHSGETIYAVARPDAQDDDVPATLTATISIHGKPRATRVFNLTVLKKLSGQAAVNADAVALSIGYAPGDSPYGITDDLILPSQGSNGSTITWASGDPAVLGDDGKIVKLPDSGQGILSVVMTATVAPGDPTRTDLEPVTRVFYSPALLEKPALDSNRLANILPDAVIHPQLVDAVLGVVANLFGLEYSAARQLLVTSPTQSAILSFQDPSGAPQDGMEAFFFPQYASQDPKDISSLLGFLEISSVIYRLYKASLILSRLKVKAAQIAWFANPSCSMQALDFNALPVAKGGKDSLFPAWQRLVTLFQLRDSRPKMDTLLDAYVANLRFIPRLVGGGNFKPVTLPIQRPWGPQPPVKPKPAKDPLPAIQALSDSLVISTDTIQNAAKTLGLGIEVADLDNYRDALNLKALLDLLSAMKKLGAGMADVSLLAEDWSKPERATLAESTTYKLLHAKYGADSWRDVMKPISDQLRPKQRDALVDYLIQQVKLRDANDLYDYFLIDPQISPGMRTSRLVQATAAVQLFVQQCLLDIVKNVSLNEDDRRRWEWMKTYRVWEAARKVFLYPENWLYPELRDDKSEIFKQLESGLGQSEPNYDLGKDQLITYMENLGETAKIRVIGMYEDEDSRTLYVVGRTPNDASRNYWRYCENFGEPTAHWSGWEKVDLNISGDHIIPFVLDGDFHIAWPVITDQKKDEGTWQIQLAWAKHTRRGWSDRRISKKSEALTLPHIPNISEERALAFERVIDDGMRINIFYAAEEQKPIQLPTCAQRNEKGVGWYENDPNKETYYFAGVSGSVYLVVSGADVLYPSPAIQNAMSYPSWTYAIGACVSIDYYGLTLRMEQASNGPQIVINERLVDTHTHLVDQFGSFHDDFATPGFQYLLDWIDVLAWATFSEYSPITRIKVTITCGDKSTTTEFTGDKLVRELVLGLGGASYKADNPALMVRVFGGALAAGFKASQSDVDQWSAERSVVMKPAAYWLLKSSRDCKPFHLLSSSITPLAVEDTRPYAGGFLQFPKDTKTLTLPVATSSVDDPDTKDVFVDPMKYLELYDEFFVVPASLSSRSLNWSTWPIWYFVDSTLICFLKTTWEKNISPLFIVDGTSATAGQFTEDLSSFYNVYTQYASDGGKAFYDHDPVNYNPGANPVWCAQDSIINKSVIFDPRSPAAIYNWEIFLHAPLLIAEILNRHQRFEDAQKWLNYVFNPTFNWKGRGGNTPAEYAQGFWQFRPFQDAGDNLQKLFAEIVALNGHWGAFADKTRVEEFNAQMHAWLAHPFSPFAVARLRYTAFEWRTIFAYLDNLLGWGDQMFRRFTRESVNEALQYYILAAKLLGPRPRSFRSQQEVASCSYREIYGQWDRFWQLWQACAAAGSAGSLPSGSDGQTEALSSLGMSYFCVPHNEKLIEYWDRVEDRLYKIRYCMDIDGVARELPLFAPPIDPELLVRAAAAGLEIDSVLAGLYTPPLPYRFNLLLQKANEICAEVKSLGAALLSVLEKKDAEELALLRSGQEVEMLNLVTGLKEQQVEEADANINVLNQNMALAREKFTQYQKLLGNNAITVDQSGLPVLSTSSSLQVAANPPGDVTGLGLVQAEVDQLHSMDEAHEYQEAAGITSTVSGVLHALPDYINGVLLAQIKMGGSHFGNAAGALASFLNMLAGNASYDASRKGMIASYQRRKDEWAFQSKLALEEMKQINKQIIAGEIRKAIAQHELENHQRQIDNAQAVDEFMHSKYTNQELYSWMAGELSAVFFSSYQIAVDMAKRAEKAFQNELAVENTSFIQPSYWDSLKKGLLAGENLALDMKRMEVAYLEQNRRELEITKPISLLQLDPAALIELKETGKCEITLPEALFDLDFPGHYLRRIKSASLTIPCVVGPYTSVNCTLTLLKHSYRKVPKPGARPVVSQGNPADDPRFCDSAGTIQSIVTSHAQNDSGLFELNFRDDRYLPFEGAGAISTWRLELSGKWQVSSGDVIKLPQFNFDTISDVILHLRYTARDGGGVMREAVLGELSQGLDRLMRLADERGGFYRLFSLRHEFPTEWSRLIGKATNGDHTQAFSLAKDRFPFLFQGGTINLVGADLFGVPKAHSGETASLDTLKVTSPSKEMELEDGAPLGNLLHKVIQFDPGMLIEVKSTDEPGKQNAADWIFSMPDGENVQSMADILLVCNYTVKF